jgi:hypothetical protein
MTTKPEIKPKAERVSEAVTLLKKLQEVGIAATTPGYVEVKKHIDDWILRDIPFTGKIDFHLHSRRGELILPTKPGTVANMLLKHHEFYDL